MGLLWACSGQDGVSVTMQEFTVEVGSNEVPGGPVTFHVRNLGAIEHELVLLETDRDPDDLPVEDAEVRTRARGIRRIAGTDRIQAGEEADLSARLRPGKYSLICNVPGHYQSGMFAALRVV